MKTTHILLLFVLGLALGGGGGFLAAKQAPPPSPKKVWHHVRRDATHLESDTRPHVSEGPAGIRVLYDAVHGARHLWNRDNRRYRTDYHTVSGWFRFMRAIQQAGYSLEAESYAGFDRTSLEGIDVVIIGEQTYHGRFMNDAEREALIGWVRDGGGLFVTVEHTNAHYMAEVFNLLVEDLPIKARYDSICDRVTTDRSSRDWVRLSQPVPHPVTVGVEEYWFYNGCSLDTEHGVLLSADEAWSDAHNPKDDPVHNGNKKKDPDERSGPLAGVAAFEFGKGRVVAIGDHNGLSNMELYIGDHHRFAMNAIQWLAGADDRPELVDWDYPEGFDLFVHAPPSSAFAVHKKSNRLSFRTVVGFWGKEPQLRPWVHPRMQTGHDALLLGAPRAVYTAEELAIVDDYLAAGKSVIWLATRNSITSDAGTQLQAKFDFEVAINEKRRLRQRLPLEVIGPADWTSEIFRVFAHEGTPRVRVTGLDPIVQLRHGAWKISEVRPQADILIDLISAKDVGPGRLYVVAPFEVFDDDSLPQFYGEKQDVIRQQVGELAITLVKKAVGDDTLWGD